MLAVGMVCGSRMESIGVGGMVGCGEGLSGSVGMGMH